MALPLFVEMDYGVQRHRLSQNRPRFCPFLINKK